MNYVGEKARRYQRQWKARRKAEFFADKTCVDCGATSDLQVDHLDPALKTGSDLWTWAPARRDAEMVNCAIRCGRCHRERHAAERRHHGAGGYNRGCRCDVCRAASAARARALRAKRRALNARAA